MDRFDPFHEPRVLRPQTRPPRQRKPPTIPRGPRWYSSLQAHTIHTGGPGAPPPGFVRATTSGDEWMWYWASCRSLDPMKNPFLPPFTGGALWDYQSPELGGFTRSIGSAVVDFLYNVSNPPLVVRIVTYFWHLAADASHQAHDRIQAIQLAGRFDVVDVPSSAYIADDTGRTAILLLKQSLGLVRSPDPITGANALLVRRAA